MSFIFLLVYLGYIGQIWSFKYSDKYKYIYCRDESIVSFFFPYLNIYVYILHTYIHIYWYILICIYVCVCLYIYMYKVFFLLSCILLVIYSFAHYHSLIRLHIKFVLLWIFEGDPYMYNIISPGNEPTDEELLQFITGKYSPATK